MEVYKIDNTYLSTPLSCEIVDTFFLNVNDEIDNIYDITDIFSLFVHDNGKYFRCTVDLTNSIDIEFEILIIDKVEEDLEQYNLINNIDDIE